MNNPKIVLKEDVANLDEVVIVGYGTQKMKNITGAIETITPDEIKDLSVGNLGDALSGMMSGLHVNSGGGRPVVPQVYKYAKVISIPALLPIQRVEVMQILAHYM